MLQHDWSSANPKGAMSHLFVSRHWLSVAARIKFKILMLAYRTATGSAPSYFHYTDDNLHPLQGPEICEWAMPCGAITERHKITFQKVFIHRSWLVECTSHPECWVPDNFQATPENSSSVFTWLLLLLLLFPYPLPVLLVLLWTMPEMLYDKHFLWQFASLSWLGFTNEDLRRTSTSSTSTLVADEAYVGQAGPATVAAGKGLVQDGCWRDTFFSFFSLCPLYWSCGYLQRVRWPDGLCATRSCDQLLVLPTDGDRYSKQ